MLNLSSGDTITINVKSIKNPNKNFDGRIKLIALAFAYNDADNDEITYFLNAGQLWTDDETSSTFNTKTYDSDYSEVILNLITLSSADGTYKFNDKQLLDPLSHTSGNYYITNSSAWSSIKTNVQLLKINNSNIISSNFCNWICKR